MYAAWWRCTTVTLAPELTLASAGVPVASSTIDHRTPLNRHMARRHFHQLEIIAHAKVRHPARGGVDERYEAEQAASVW